MLGNEKGQAVRDVVLDAINEGVFTVGRDWRITSFNRSAARITGWPQDKAIGRPCCEVFQADICTRACTLRRTLETGRPVTGATAQIVNDQGERVPIRISTAILRDRRGRVMGGVETFQDLSLAERSQPELQGRCTLGDIIGRSPPMARLFHILPLIAESSSTVLIEGPSGTGKELFARAIHALSPRRANRFVPVSCAALPDSLLESELFGYKAGAFTDARQDKAGRFLWADGGTIFLDEIGDISPAMQVRLLRVLQDRVVEPLGTVRPTAVDVRVLAATHRDLEGMVRRGAFREDLYYRIHVARLKLPSLRQRREDIPLLVAHRVEKLNGLQGKAIAGVSPEAMACLMAYDYPGNVRELENIIEQAFVLRYAGVITLDDLPVEVLRRAPRAPADPTEASSLRAIECRCIAESLLRHGGHRQRTAQALGVDPSTLYRKIRAYGIAVPLADGRSRKG